MDKKTIIHVHIEKTGGTTLGQLYRDKYGDKNVLNYSAPHQTFQKPNIPESEINKIIRVSVKAILKHCPQAFNTAKFVRDFFLIYINFKKMRLILVNLM